VKFKMCEDVPKNECNDKGHPCWCLRCKELLNCMSLFNGNTSCSMYGCPVEMGRVFNS